MKDETCQRCHQREAKLKQLTAHYRKLKAQGKLHMGFAMIDLYWRNKLTIQETAKILGISVRQVEFERDIVRQNAE
ncbi:MAG: hypothetical protein OXU27_03195 [Candidatus Poribacteria bacterium]|nr:hypothetical protein [Candidatus Poribacteria bacterium]